MATTYQTTYARQLENQALNAIWLLVTAVFLVAAIWMATHAGDSRPGDPVKPILPGSPPTATTLLAELPTDLLLPEAVQPATDVADQPVGGSGAAHHFHQ